MHEKSATNEQEQLVHMIVVFRDTCRDTNKASQKTLSSSFGRSY